MQKQLYLTYRFYLLIANSIKTLSGKDALNYVTSVFLHHIKWNDILPGLWIWICSLYRMWCNKKSVYREIMPRNFFQSSPRGYSHLTYVTTKTLTLFNEPKTYSASRATSIQEQITRMTRFLRGSNIYSTASVAQLIYSYEFLVNQNIQCDQLDS